jgi:hypothetical protein
MFGTKIIRSLRVFLIFLPALIFQTAVPMSDPLQWAPGMLAMTTAITTANFFKTTAYAYERKSPRVEPPFFGNESLLEWFSFLSGKWTFFAFFVLRPKVPVLFMKFHGVMAKPLLWIFPKSMPYRKELAILTSAGAVSYGLWKIMKHSAEWYVNKRGVLEKEETITVAPKPENNPPLALSENIAQAVLFNDAMTKKSAEWYKKIPEKEREECPICRDTIEPKDLHITNCKQSTAVAVHYYHTTCINDWKNLGHTECPTCKGAMLDFRISESEPVVAIATKTLTTKQTFFGWMKSFFRRF